MTCLAFHWWRTVFFLIPADQRLHDRARDGVAGVDAVRSDRGDFGHRCARAWSWLILKTTGVHGHGLAASSGSIPSRSYVFAANHQSIYDIPIVFASLPVQLRIISKDSLGPDPVPRAGTCSAPGHLLVDRSKSGRRHREEDGAAGPASGTR